MSNDHATTKSAGMWQFRLCVTRRTLSWYTALHLRSLSVIHEAFLPISPAPQAFTRGQLARSLGTFGPVFPQARGLRPGADAPWARLSRAPTPTPPPPLPEALEFR